ncbi:hypothetical protein [Flexithrix dorotheae]|uniref:hypothetical protein n=1 Tax=Flexithrix dorotheae TaxID=70993 RepID=UPI000381D58E|nr:hypothetical protein [Flexithrix dorotheae]
MRKGFIIYITAFLLISCRQKKTELILIGTVHSPVENFNSDSLYNILLSIKPDLILYEVDSSFFTPEFKFKKEMSSNEYLATTKYIEKFKIPIRPYDFTGRNEYRKNIGSRPTDSKALGLLDSLYWSNSLNQESKNTYKEYLVVDSCLNALAYLGPVNFNQLSTDSLAQLRQSFQYDKLMKVMNTTPVFSEKYAIKPDGDSISYNDGFSKAAEFWHMRNQAMGKHIRQFISLNPGKRIVVLNGFFHRYYLRSELVPYQEELSFVIRDFYDY